MPPTRNTAAAQPPASAAAASVAIAALHSGSLPAAAELAMVGVPAAGGAKPTATAAAPLGALLTSGLVASSADAHAAADGASAADASALTFRWECEACKAADNTHEHLACVRCGVDGGGALKRARQVRARRERRRARGGVRFGARAFLRRLGCRRAPAPRACERSRAHRCLSW
jgi:hypothetical protein